MSDESKKNLIAELLKSALSTGKGAASLTEEIVKTIAAEVTSKESVSQVLEAAKNSKDDVLQGIKGEIAQQLKKIDLQSEVDRILSEYDININAKVNFKKKKKK